MATACAYRMSGTRASGPAETPIGNYPQHLHLCRASLSMKSASMTGRTGRKTESRRRVNKCRKFHICAKFCRYWALVTAAYKATLGRGVRTGMGGSASMQSLNLPLRPLTFEPEPRITLAGHSEVHGHHVMIPLVYYCNHTGTGNTAIIYCCITGPSPDYRDCTAQQM